VVRSSVVCVCNTIIAMLKILPSILLLMLIALGALDCRGQQYFHVQSSIGEITIEVNGKTYTIDSTFSRIKTHYPGFDTLLFRTVSDGMDREILCNFQPDSVYTFLPACCGSIDIVPFRETQVVEDSLWWDDFEGNFDKIQAVFLDRPFVTLKVVNGSVKDSVYGWYSDHACWPSFKLLDSIGWGYGAPVKCFYWNNISTFVFFTGTGPDTAGRNEQGVVEDDFPEDYFATGYAKLGDITVRLFDRRRYVITYDVASGRVELAYE
jgi:hypothetical protein